MHSLFLPQPNRASARPLLTSFSPQTSTAHLRITPIPYAQWPLWVRAIFKFHHAKDAGLGDTVVHLIGDARSERFKKWFLRKFGKGCGCTERQRWLNRKFPYTGSGSVQKR